jgi:hypothetical protein
MSNLQEMKKFEGAVIDLAPAGNGFELVDNPDFLSAGSIRLAAERLGTEFYFAVEQEKPPQGRVCMVVEQTQNNRYKIEKVLI